MVTRSLCVDQQETKNGALPVPQVKLVVSDEEDDFDDEEYSGQPSIDQLSTDEDLRGRIIGPSTGTTRFDLDGQPGSHDIVEEEEDRIPDNHVNDFFSGRRSPH